MEPVAAIGARLGKLRAMSLQEIAQRVRYRAVIGIEREQYRFGLLNPCRELDQFLDRPLQGTDWKRRLLDSRRSRPARFLAGVHNREAMRRLFKTEYRDELASTLKHAALARNHRFLFFGREFQYGDEIDWQADPVTGRRWPQRYHADVPVHSGDIGCGDVKYVWELSRQQFLIDLGKAFFLTDDEAHVQALKRLVRSWIVGNPYATGVNWSCALEPAFRALSWVWAYHLTADSLDDEFHVEWLAAFYDHGRFLARHLEHYSSPYNHLIGEASALYILGMCFPEFRSSRRWCVRARGVLERRLREQFYPDGGSVEQSTFYHHATIGFYLLAALTARENGEELSADVWRAIERGIDFSTKLLQPDGKTPEIGGADDGKPIRMAHLPFWDFRPYHAVGAVLFSRSDFKRAAGRFFEDALWLLGPEGRERFDALAAAPPRQASVALASSGYYIMRSHRSNGTDYVCFDCGEQAAGMRPDGVPNSMHGHADCLSIIVWLGGRRVLVDSGLYGYNCGGAWEAHFRETAGHNTARVDGREQARHIGKMAWSHSYRATAEGWMADDRQAWVVGSHDGYSRGPNGVTHRRAVWLRPGGYLLILDEFVGHGTHDFEVNYQFAPGLLEAPHQDRATFDGAVEIAWAGTGVWASKLRSGGPTPQDGWICSSLGMRGAAPRLTLATRSSQPRLSLLTVLADSAQSERRILTANHREKSGTAPALVGIAGDGYTDWVVAGPSSEPLKTDASIAICRVQNGLEVEAARIGGTYLRADTDALTRLGRARTPAQALV